MVKWIFTIGIVGIVALISALIIFFRARYIIEPEKIEEKGLDTVVKEDATGFAMLAVMFSGIIYLSFKGLYLIIDEKAVFIIQTIAIIAIIMLSVFAAKIRPANDLEGVYEVILLNIVWGVGLGILFPIYLI